MYLIKTSDVKTCYVLKQCFKLDVLAGKDINNIFNLGKRIISELKLYNKYNNKYIISKSNYKSIN